MIRPDTDWLTGVVPGLVDDLTAVARSVAGPDGEPRVLSDRADAMVLRLGDVVVKAHPPGTGKDRLTTRVRLAGEPALRPVLLPPLSGPLAVRDRLVTVWPAGTPVDATAPDRAPWQAGARLLARLHAVPVPSTVDRPVPAAGGPGRVTRALARLDGITHAAAGTVRRAYRGLPDRARGARTDGSSLVHGDWHLGQLVCTGQPGHTDQFVRTDEWRLIDVDDLGVGDPAWDLARPAALFATGLLAPEVWRRFLAAYRAAGGCAVPGTGDEWERLDVPARALVVQCAALAVVAADRDDRPLDEADRALVDACARMAPRSCVFAGLLR